MILTVNMHGVSLSHLATCLIHKAACKLSKTKKSEYKIVNDDVEGIVWTDFESVSFGGTAGYLFHADIETKAGKTNVVYLIKEESLVEDAEIRIRKSTPRYLKNYGNN